MVQVFEEDKVDLSNQHSPSVVKEDNDDIDMFR